MEVLRPDSVLQQRWVEAAVTRSGMKFKWAKVSETRERENRDAIRRCGHTGELDECDGRSCDDH